MDKFSMKSPARLLQVGSAAVAGLCLGAAAICIPAGAAQKAPTLASALAASTADANRAGSVRVSVKFVSGGQTGDLVVDSSAAAGQETLKFGNQLVGIVLVNGVVYITGNSHGLTAYFGLPASSATALSGRWISFASTDDGYQTFLSDVALPSVLKSVTPTGTLVKEKNTSLSGKPVVAIAGKGPAGETRGVLFLQSTGARLPVEAVISNGAGKKARGEIVNFTRWGEKINPAAPKAPISVATLKARSTPPG
jgi:hypothetical protein